MTSKFREGLKVVENEQKQKKERELDAYRVFISEALPGYIGFMEAINSTITMLKNNGIIGKTKLRTRLKAVDSAITNTQKKILDDVFGFEIVAESERDKEILMLIIHNLFEGKYIREKNFNKSNGYFAHHCTGAVKRNLNGTESKELENHILDSETWELKPEYRDLSRKEQKQYKKSEIYCKKPRYPILIQEILNNGQLDITLQQNFEKSLNFINQYLSRDSELRKNMPIFEIQFKTLDVEQEIKCGRAQHVKYKSVNEEEVEAKYFQRKLIRGVDFPFTFIRNDEGEIELEHSSRTLISMWPFLENAIMEYKAIHSCPVANYDMYFAKAFPSLEPYIQRNLVNEPSLPVINCKEEAWGILRNKIINNTFVLPQSNEIAKVVGRD